MMIICVVIPGVDNIAIPDVDNIVIPDIDKQFGKSRRSQKLAKYLHHITKNSLRGYEALYVNWLKSCMCEVRMYKVEQRDKN